ncbi:Arylsulfotransferase ASST protein [Rutstroemia sp. NJR-2017a BBW]|nr:Arylsulfotransferase ASST protein [Rutstroemia sp. NJR-2017a BBW]
MIISVANITIFDLSPINGPTEGWVYDSQFYEVDIKTNEILFRWSSVESGIPITYTKLALGEGTAGNGTRDSPFDWFHVNAISSAGDGYLVNSRHCWTTWMLDEAGTIQWKIEGNNTESLSDFTLPTDGLFEWQHHARYQNLTESGVTLHYFNNRNSNFSNGTNESNGLELNLNLLDYTVTVEKKLTDPSDPIYTESQGAFNPLANGNTFMGWGSIAKLKEFGPNGNNDVRLTMQFGGKDLVQSYRAYRQSWNATPIANPAAVGRSSTAWMSWNGATDHTAWNVYAGTVKTDLSLVGTVQRNNMFEVSYPLPSNAQFLQVAAYRESTWLRNSSVVTVGPFSHPVDVGDEEDGCDA